MSTRFVLAGAGAIIGGIYGGPTGAQIGWTIGSIVGGVVDPQVIKGPRIGDIPAQTAQDGLPRAIIFGVAPVTGQIMMRSEVRKGTERQEQGKGSGPVSETPVAYQDFTIEICESSELKGTSIKGIRRAWGDGVLVYDVSENPAISAADSANWKQNVTFYFGGESQGVDPTEEAITGVGQTPAYRGTCRAVFSNFKISDHGNRIPTYKWEVVSAGTQAAGTGGGSWIATNGNGKFQKSDGIDWTTNSPYTNAGTGANLIYGGGILVATDTGNTSHSLDKGDSFSASSFSSGTGDDNSHGSYVSGKFWTAQSSPAQSVAYSDGGANFVSVATGNAHAFTSIVATATFVCAFDNRDGVRTSSDLFATSNYQTLFSNIKGTYCCGTNGSRVCAVDQAGSASYSDDGISWATPYTIAGISGSSTSGPRNVKGVGNTWVLVGGAGIWYSTDNAASFTQATLPNTIFATDVDIGDGLIVVVGRRLSGSGVAVIMTAPLSDPTTWTERANNYGLDNITSVAYMACDDGYSMPDVDGWRVHDDLSFCGAAEGAITPETVSLPDIITLLAGRNGVGASKLDLTELAGKTVRGYKVHGDYNSADSIEPLRRTYFFDMPEYDKQVHAVLRGGAIARTIVPGDIVSGEEFSIEDPRGQQLEFPRLLHLRYLDADQNYADTKQTSTRFSEDIRVKGELSIEAPINMSADEAAQNVHKLHKAAWASQRGPLKLTLPLDYLDLVPSDAVAYDGKRWLLDTMTLDAWSGKLQILAPGDIQSAYTSNVTGVPPPDPIPPDSRLYGPTLFAFLNCRPLQDSDDQLGVYVMVGGILSGWKGAQIDLSADAGDTFIPVATPTFPHIIGYTTAELPLAPAEFIDTDNTMSVLVHNDAPSSITLTQFLSEGNPCALVDDSGVCELLQFQTVTQTATKEYDLTTLQRGRLGSEPQAWPIGSRFVLIERPIFIPLPRSYLGKTLQFRVTSLGTSSDNAPIYEYDFTPGQSQYELPPVNFAAARDGSDNVTVTWVGQALLGTTADPYDSANFTGYAIDYTSGGTTIRRTTTDVTDTYTAAQQAVDFGSTPGSLSIVVRGLNRITGDGEPSEAITA